MSENHIVKVPYSERGFCRTRPVFQYDYGQVLQLEGFPDGMLPAAYEVHFDIGNNQSVTMIGQENGASIPDSCLTGFGSVNAWLFLHDTENDGETRFTINIPLKQRAEPTDIEPTPVQQDVITQTVAALNSAVNDVKASNANVIRVSDTEPDDEDVKIWVKPESEEYRIPTWEEHRELVDEANSLRNAVEEMSRLEQARVHICGTDEYNHTTGIPSISDPNERIFYLVPGGVNTPNVYSEWIYINQNWEQVGISSVDIGHFLHKTDIDDSAGINSVDKIWSASQSANVAEAKADKTDTVLNTTLSRGRTQESGAGSVAFGYSVVASGDYSQALGESTTAFGYASHAEGYQTTAINTGDHSEGILTVANGGGSHGEGFGTSATGSSSHSEGNYTAASGNYSHADGTYTNASGNASQAHGVRSTASGYASTAEGTDTVASGNASHSEGEGTIANAPRQHVSGKYNVADPVSGGQYAVIVGNGTDGNARSNAAALLWNGDVRFAGDVYVGCDADSTGGNKLAKIGDIPTLPDISGKQDAPSAAGFVGQVLGLDANLHPAWINQETGAEIDDTAGTGDTDKVWSANKIATEISGLSDELDDKYEKPVTGIPGTDIADGVIPDVSGFYSKPATGIPASDLASGVIPDVSGFYTKPAGGIPASDLASGVIPSVPVTDVQVNGTSILSQGVANVPMANATDPGVIKIGNGVNVDGENKLNLNIAASELIKNGVNQNYAIAPVRQHEAAFYGLAKAAGDTSQSSSSNAVGTYTETAKSKIHEMLDSPVTVSGSTPSITAKSGIRYLCGTVTEISITLPQSGIIDVVFTAGSNCVLTLPNTVKLPGWFDATSLDTGTTYEINIMDGVYGAVMAWT